MSVLIKGMEMPKTCEECALNYDSYACIKTGSSFFRGRETEFDPFEGRLEDCPLVPVPPHGRLVDADALKAHGDCLSRLRVDYDAPAGHQVWRECVPFDDIPTIIPAESPKEET